MVNNTLIKTCNIIKLRHTQVLVIDLLESGIKLEELFFSTIIVNGQAIDVMKQVMFIDSPLADKL